MANVKPPANAVIVSGTASQTITGDGKTIVVWQWPNAAGPWPENINKGRGLFTNPDGSVYATEEHTSGQKLTLINCYSLVVGVTAGNPGGTVLLVSDAKPESGLPPLPIPVVARSISRTGMAALVHFSDGSAQIFNQADGTDLGDYTNPFTGKSHKNVSVLGSNFFRVIFRPESDRSRFEAQFEWGNIFSPVLPDLGPISAEIFNNGTKIGDARSAKHFWGSTWFWESAPRPVIRSVAQLVSEKWVLPQDATATRIPRPKDAPAYVPMGFSDITPDMPRTGGRPDIGLRHQRSACLIATGDTSLIPSILDWGRCALTISANVTDPWKSAPISLDDFPTLNFYGSTKDSHPFPVGYSQTTSSGIIFDGSSHLPELPFLPFALTGDIKFLLAAQRIMTVLLAQDPYEGKIIRHDATRIYAWGLRELFNICRMMRDMKSVPSCLLPYSYWKAALDKNRDWFFENYVNNPSPLCSILRIATVFVSEAFWQSDYLGQVLGDGVWKGNEDWRRAFVWKIGSNIARTNGTSGWPRAYPSAYFVGLYLDQPPPQPNTIGTIPVSTWAELASVNASVLGNIPANGSLSRDNDYSYVAHCRGVLAIGTKRVIVPEAAASFAWLDPKARALNGPGSGIDWQEAF